MNERDIFTAALHRPPEERSAFLDEACHGDARLRQQVVALLHEHAQLGSYLESPALAAVATIDDPITERPGTVVGPYKLLEPIGEGGFGVVFLAEQQQPLRRKVALKVLKPGMDTRQVVARFEAERQALALMDHPNIARVFDGGATPSGRPYFVMELVKGAPITEFCDKSQLTPRQRLELFVSVCQAVQHAHQKGIIHRDLKPSNILVTVHDTAPVVKVIDFGVAKALGQELTDKTLFTGFAQLLGTPLYMSPEQAGQSGLDVDTRSDVYSLGVLLYELLTGTTPFDRDRLRAVGYDEMRRIIREEEPPRPSTRLSSSDILPAIAAARQTEPAKLARLVRGELDWIVMKALEKDRTRRYETANGLARDIQRYLADEPVEACPPSAGYRLKKFARRHKAGLAVAGLVLFFLVLLGGSIGWAVRDRESRRAAADGAVAQALVEVRLLRDQARAKPLGDGSRFREALVAARKAEELARASGASGELRQQAADLGAELEQEAAAADRDRRLLARVLDVRGPREGPKYVRGEKDTMMELAELSADEQFASAFRDWGLDVDATGVAEAAARLKGRPPAVVTEVVVALDEWASERRRQGAAPAKWQRLADLAAALDDQPGSRRRELRAVLTRGNLPLERALGEVSRAFLPLPALTGVVPWPDRKRLRRLAEETDATKEPVLGLLTLTRALQLGGDDAVAERLLREAVRARPAEVVLHDALGKLLKQQWPPRWAEAVECYAAARALRPELGEALALALEMAGRREEGLPLCQRLVAEKPDNPRLHFQHGNALSSQGKHQEAEAAYRAAIRLKPDYSEAHNNLGAILNDRLGRSQEAEAAFREAIRLKKDDSDAYSNLGNALYAQGKQKEAEAAWREAIRLNPINARAHTNLGNALYAQGKQKEAEAAWREAIRLNPINARAHTNLGGALIGQGKYKEAEPALREAIRLDPNYAEAHNTLGVALGKQGRYPEAEAAHRQAIRLKANYPEAHYNLGTELIHQGRYQEAEGPNREAIRLKPALPEAHTNLGVVLNEQGRHKEAEEVCRAAICLKHDLPQAHNNLGFALNAQGKHREAEVVFRAAIRLKASSAQAHDGLGVALNAQGKQKEAKAAWGEAIRLKPDFAFVNFRQGYALSSQGKHKEAEAAYRAAIRLNPDYSEAHHNLGCTLDSQGKHKEAEAALREAIRLNPDYAPAYFNLGVTLRSQGKHKEAEEAFRKAQPLNERLVAGSPTTTDHRRALADNHVALAKVLMDLSRWVEAEAAWRKALPLSEQVAAERRAEPEHRERLAACHVEWSTVLRALGKRAEAEAALRKALVLHEELPAAFSARPEKRGGHAYMLNRLGIVLAEQGKHKEAEAAYRRAIAVSVRLVKDFPRVGKHRVSLAGYAFNLGVLLHESRPVEALSWYDLAVAVLQDQQPGDPTMRQHLGLAQKQRAKALGALRAQLKRAASRARAGKAAEAVADAEGLTKQPATPGIVLYDAACVISLAAAAVKEDKQRETYAGKAMALLRRAQGGGLFKNHQNVEHLKKDADLDALRSQEDFKKFIADLETAAKR
jgi:tetratricopeptide (TPR) repeat protein